MEKNVLLTIIIPFLNEKEEVGNTLSSLFEYLNEKVDIILINDASTDNFNYESVLEKYDVAYIKNERRQGVAACREIGVQMCKTPFFLFLDAHMRFYDNTWYDILIKNLNENPQTILCCQTRFLIKENDVIVEKKEDQKSFGAIIDLKTPASFFEPKWLYLKNSSEIKSQELISIPCILGAGYACNKVFWNYIKGVEGLKYYGYDEAYLSIKSWLTGGNCKLITSIEIGHIYRFSAPYSNNDIDIIYNKMLLSILVTPNTFKKKLFSYIRFIDMLTYEKAVGNIIDNINSIMSLKTYYSKIFIKDFSSFEELNDHFANMSSRDVESHKDLLEAILINVIAKNQTSNNIGLLKGRMGIVLFLYHYAHYFNERWVHKIAGAILEDIFEELTSVDFLNFNSGILGIGWGIEYLSQNQLIDANTNDLLEEIDQKLMDCDLDQIENLNQEKGLGGVMKYIVARLYSVEKEKRNNPFDVDFLNKLYSVVKKHIELGHSSDCIDTFIEFVLYQEKSAPLEQVSIYDVTYLFEPENYSPQNFSSGLDGNSGVGISLILKITK
jgi:glycosyltransferase involved in cell wall biosynthesis